MPFVFEQPNLDNEAESHLYFDPGDGRLITVFTNEEREPVDQGDPKRPGRVHHLAFARLQGDVRPDRRPAERSAGSTTAASRTTGSWTRSTSTIPLGQLIELAAYRFEPPAGHTHTDVLLEAHKLREERGDYNIAQEHLADAIELLVERSQASLSGDRAPKNPYGLDVLARPARSDARRLVRLLGIDGRPGRVHQAGGPVALVQLEQRLERLRLLVHPRPRVALRRDRSGTLAIVSSSGWIVSISSHAIGVDTCAPGRARTDQAPKMVLCGAFWL